MNWHLTVSSIFLISIFGWFAFSGQPASAPLEAAISHQDLAAFGFIDAQVATTAAPVTTAAATPTPLPPTPIPVAPTPAPGKTTANTGTGLPIVPIFLGIMFLGVVLAVSLPIIRSRFGRR